MGSGTGNPAAGSGAVDDTGAAGWESSYRDALSRAVLASERRRMALVAGVLALALAVFLLALFVPGVMPKWTHERFLGMAPFIVGAYGGMCVYELLARAWVGRRMRAGRAPVTLARYANAALEMTLPTALIFVATRVFGAADALAAPPIFIYVILIILMTLELDGRLCAFAGFVGGTQYLLLALYVLPARDAVVGGVGGGGGADVAPVTVLGVDPTPHVLRGGMIVLAGITAAFVAGQLRRQFDGSARAVAQREHAVGVFGQHVSPQVAERLLAQRGRAGGGDGNGRDDSAEVREVCVMFLDIRDFTAFADGRSPEQVMAYLNRLFAPMIDTINRHGGIINKFLGDGFMAVFGAPAADGEAARHAVHAALELVEQVRRRNEDDADDIPPTRTGVGLHAGPAVTGDLGSAGRKEYTVIGGVVNLASRMEQLNKQFDTRVLASAAVVAGLPEAEAARAHSLGEVAVRGQSAPVAVFQLA